MLYFDTSFITPIFRKEASTSDVERFLQRRPPGELAISHWTRVEFSSLLARDVRMQIMERSDAVDLDTQFEAIISRTFVVLLPDRDDFDLCKYYIQRFDTGLRGGDALHLAIAHIRRAEAVYTLDKKLLKAGKLLGLPVSSGLSEGA